ncbi:MAG: MarR family transcriptional regulator [Halieaceae bacterium]|jgi:DNA-binding MarR family transcriptional regulator|nr:MarR family transcriptional regulator [Halieaceae bacterium]
MHSKRLARTSGLTAPQILLLQAVNRLEGATLGRLASEVSLSQATVTTIMDRLEGRGLVERERSTTDKRRVHVRLTELGQITLRDAPTPLQEQFARQFAELEEWEQTMILAALQRVAHMMDAEDIDASPVLYVGSFEKPVTAVEK